MATLENTKIIDAYIALAVAEDLGDGDHTSLACIPDTALAKAAVFAKENGIIAGIEIARKIFTIIDKNVQFQSFYTDGQKIKIGDKIIELSGKSRSLLLGERLMLNYMQRMSGIATQTRKMVNLIKGTQAVLLDTRKTTPNNRIFEKMAVAIGGGQNHRFGLYDMMMIKDNHIDFAGGLTLAIDAANAYLKSTHKNLAIEIEVRNFEELKQVLRRGDVQRIMLDNFSPEEVQKAVTLIKGRCQTEASGGITAKNLKQYAQTGVDYISMGALTHHIKSLDLSMRSI
ncbi:MAG: carboxylating nicotinate-nucleotide diphosphorylase [Bacteroidales bacterium]